MHSPAPSSRTGASGAPSGAGRALDRAARWSLVVLAVLAMIAALKLASSILIPIVAAIVLGSIIGPALARINERFGLPRFVSPLIVVFAVFGILYSLFVVFSTPLASWIGRAPEVGALLQERFRAVRQPMEVLRQVQEALKLDPSKTEITVNTGGSMIESIVSVATPAIGQVVLFFGSLLFFLAGRLVLRRKIVAALGDRERRLSALRIINSIEERLGTYLQTTTMINAGLGLATGLAMWAIGLPNPALWGLLAGTLNYVPYAGPAVMTAILAVAGLISFDTMLWALLPPVAFLAMATLEGQWLQPLIVGKRVELNPFAVFLAIAFWTWLWGPAGTFLAVPLLITGSAVIHELKEAERIELPG